MHYRSVHTLCQKGNKAQSLCFDAKRRKCHQYLYLQIGFLPAFSSVFHCTSAKNVKAPDSWTFMQSPPPPQLSSRYSKPKAARVRVYFTLVRMAIITKTSVFVPFDVMKEDKGK